MVEAMIYTVASLMRATSQTAGERMPGLTSHFLYIPTKFEGEKLKKINK